jgi:steroid delta-isomerase-like uncharacterized protein
MGANLVINDNAAAAYNAGDIAGFCAYYAPDAILTTPDGTFTGLEAIFENWTKEKAAFPDSKVTMTLVVEDGDKLVSEWTWTATNTGDLSLPDGTTLPATGKSVTVNGMDVTELRDGKIVSQRMYFDNMTAFTQLGLIPATA